MKISETAKSKIKNDVGEYLVESILSSASASKSPVAGESFPALSKIYKKRKIAEGHAGKPNLELEGDMLDALTFKETKNGIELGWFGDQAPKADGHNNFSGKSDLPQRRVLPAEGQEFVSRIQGEVEKIIADAVADGMSFNTDDFEGVESKSDLYEALDEYFPGMSKAEIKGVIARTPDLAHMLDGMDLIGLL